MVQRKVPNKLGIQADRVKSDKVLVNLKPSSPQLDGKNRGADLKKKMKKSRSIKRSDLDSLRSSPPQNKEIPQPGKPPPPPVDHVSSSSATPQKQSSAKAQETSPNYMKSTSSFDARKELSQVNSRNLSNISKSSSTKNSKNLKNSTSSCHKAAGTSARTSSLKLMRTLTKSPSFKPSRAGVKKYSPVVLCENLDVQKATCSSTLKDSKFPAYLTLSPGATEAEGTSVMKVCPYTYCSLNGHHHNPSPPLKSFLKARRRMLKTQKSFKLGCLSPRRAKPSGDSLIDIEAGNIIFVEKPAIEEQDLISLPRAPLIQEEHPDFFIEIYRNDRDETAENIAQGNLESLSGKSSYSDIDSEGNLNQSSDEITTEMEIAEFDKEAKNVEEEKVPSIQLSRPDSEALDMEWEEGNYYEPSLHYVPNLILKEIDSHGFYDEPFSKLEDNISSSFEDILADEVLVGFYDEESVSSEAWFNDGDSELDGSYQNMEIDDTSGAFDEQSQDHLHSIYDALEEQITTDDIVGYSKSDETLSGESTWAPIEDHVDELKATNEDKNGLSEASDKIPKMNLQLGVDETKCTSNIKEALIDHQEDESDQEDCVCGLVGYQDTSSAHDFMERDHNEGNKDYNASYKVIEVNQFDSTTETRCSNEVSDGSLQPKTEDLEADKDYRDQELPAADAGDGVEEKEQFLATESFAGIQTFDLSQDFSEPKKVNIDEDNDESKQEGVRKESETSQNFVGEGLPNVIQDQLGNKQSQSNDVLGNQDHAEIDQDGAGNRKTSNSMNFEDKTHSGTTRLSSVENGDQDAETIEGDNAAMSDPEETGFTTKIASGTETKGVLARVRSNSSDQMSQTCKNPSWTIRHKRPIEEQEETRDFNPREPNYLPVDPDPEAEKVDLKHQIMDERKNAEEWMIDYALQQAVTKLAPARKRKVALLVEAFEKVLPIPKYEARLRHTSAFVHARPIQACR